MIDSHHVRPVLALADLEYANALPVYRDRLIRNADRRLDVVSDDGLVMRFASEILAVDGLHLFVAAGIDFDTGNDVSVAFDGSIRERQHITQKAAQTVRTIGVPGEMHSGAGRCLTGYFEKTVHRQSILNDHV
jgi:hypothetical protein